MKETLRKVAVATAFGLFVALGLGGSSAQAQTGYSAPIFGPYGAVVNQPLIVPSYSTAYYPGYYSGYQPFRPRFFIGRRRYWNTPYVAPRYFGTGVTSSTLVPPSL